MVLLFEKQYESLAIISVFCSISYFVLAYALIIRNCGTFDRFTLLITFFGLLSALMDTSAAFLVWTTDKAVVN